MWVQAFQSEEKAHEFLELMSLGDVQPLTVPWKPEPGLNVDEYSTWERRGFGEAGLTTSGSYFYSEYTAAVRMGRTFLLYKFFERDANEPFFGRLPTGILGTMLSRWTALTNPSVRNPEATYPAVKQEPTPTSPTRQYSMKYYLRAF